MITVKLHTTYGRENRAYNLKHFECVGSDMDSGYINLYKGGDSYTIRCSVNSVYLKIYGLLDPDYGNKSHLEGLTYKIESGKEYHLTEIFERLDNEPILIEYIKYRLFPGKFPNESTMQYLCG